MACFFAPREVFCPLGDSARPAPDTKTPGLLQAQTGGATSYPESLSGPGSGLSTHPLSEKVFPFMFGLSRGGAAELSAACGLSPPEPISEKSRSEPGSLLRIRFQQACERAVHGLFPVPCVLKNSPARKLLRFDRLSRRGDPFPARGDTGQAACFLPNDGSGA